MTIEMNRRSFVKAGAAMAVGMAVGSSAAKAVGANDKVRLGIMGVNNRGGQLIDCIQKLPGAEIVAICDVYQPFLDKCADKLDGKPEKFGDFRKMLDRKDIDAVVIATPDHWHALQTIMACEADKDVYVEKPVSITIHEGRKMVEAARRTNRIVQVGVHRRSGKIFAEIADLVQKGTIGKVTVARCYHISNMWPAGMGKAEDSEPPKGLDWDMWLGPRAVRPYRSTIAPYKFRWWHEYSSQIANQGVHYLDLIRWILHEEAPASVVALGGKYAVDDDRDIPDTMEAIFELPSGCLLVFGQYEASNNPAMKTGFVELRGTKGTLYMEDSGYQIIPEKGGQFQDSAPRMEPADVRGSDGNMTVQHLSNFLDCIKSREKPNADIEVGHRSTTFSHLGNIALAMKSRLDWDAVNERVTNNEDANKLLQYEYRPPWKLS